MYKERDILFKTNMFAQFENDPMLIFKFYMGNFHAILYGNLSSII